MPITSRSLDYAREQRDGRFRCRVSGVDTAGRNWASNPFWADSAAEAEDVRDNFVYNIEGRDSAEVLLWVQGRNDVANFNFTGLDLTEDQAEEHIVTWFATRDGDEAITVAWWIESLSPPSYTAIADRIGYTTEQRTIVQDRAIALLDAESLYNTKVTL